MRLTIPPLEILDDDAFPPEKDIFSFKPYGERLMRLVEVLNDPAVIAFDGAWGSGKSTFIKMWCALLRENKFPVIYFDAFGHDYCENAFIPIASRLVELSDEYKSADKENIDFIKSVYGIGKKILRASGKIAVRAATYGIIDEIDAGFLGKIRDEIASEAAELTDDVLLKQLISSKQEAACMDSFKSTLSQLVQDINSSYENDNIKPLVFVVDELDRCKPSFSLELIEIIKHVFSVPHVHFVLVTNMEQLHESVTCVYGAKNPEKYLQKFYNIYTNIESFYAENAKDNTYAYTRKIILNHFDASDTDAARIYIDTILYFSEINNYSLRDVEKVCTYCQICLLAKDKIYKIHTVLACLCIIKALNSNLYMKIQLCSAKFDDVVNFLFPQSTPDRSKRIEESGAMCHLEILITGKGKEDYKKHYESKFHYYHANYHNEILKNICAIIDSYDFLTIET